MAAIDKISLRHQGPFTDGVCTPTLPVPFVPKPDRAWKVSPTARASEGPEHSQVLIPSSNQSYREIVLKCGLFLNMRLKGANRFAVEDRGKEGNRRENRIYSEKRLAVEERGQRDELLTQREAKLSANFARLCLYNLLRSSDFPGCDCIEQTCDKAAQL